jgi:hypothetical protein
MRSLVGDWSNRSLVKEGRVLEVERWRAHSSASEG